MLLLVIYYFHITVSIYFQVSQDLSKLPRHFHFCLPEKKPWMSCIDNNGHKIMIIAGCLHFYTNA